MRLPGACRRRYALDAGTHLGSHPSCRHLHQVRAAGPLPLTSEQIAVVLSGMDGVEFSTCSQIGHSQIRYIASTLASNHGICQIIRRRRIPSAILIHLRPTQKSKPSDCAVAGPCQGCGSDPTPLPDFGTPDPQTLRYVHPPPGTGSWLD